MKHVIIGTAGHVDHGKTLLIRALTGIDTDRLQEEKTRGITIELGFAHLDFEDGTQAGIVDVPGHEKFIKNMLAGAGGIDLAMLVIAADEGFMPQTAEHLDILSLLGISSGLVVLTKTDLVEPRALAAVTEDVRERVRGTFLEGQPILPVSAVTGEGIDALKRQLWTLVKAAPEKGRLAPFRLPIDRVFSADGFGTVVTGTLMEGCVRTGDAVELLPSGLIGKVRSLQVHGKSVNTAYAGQRLAINLAGVKKEELRRGDTAANPGSVPVGSLLDVRLRNLPNSQRVIHTGSQVHLYHGARALLCRVVLLEQDELRPGEDGFAQLRLAEPLAAKNGDRFVIRFLSPLETIGGGMILDASPRKHKRNDPAVLDILRIKESGSDEQRVLQALSEFGCSLPGLRKLAEILTLDENTLEQTMEDLLRRGKAVEALPGRYLSAAVLNTTLEHCRQLLEQHHTAHPLHTGIRPAELRQKLFPAVDPALADAILDIFLREGTLRRAADRYALPEFRIRLTRRQARIREKLLKLYRNTGLSAPGLNAVQTLFPPAEQEDFRQVLESLLTNGQLVRMTAETVYHASTVRTLRQTAESWFVEHETLTLAEFRDLLGTSRKTALVVLEYFDRNQLTRKEGNLRRAGPVPFF